MNKLLAVPLFGVIMLTGCLYSSAIIGTKTELYVTKRQTGFYKQTVITKTNKAKSPYDLWANSYAGDNLGRNPPNTLTITYAVIPWEKDKAWSMGLDNYIKIQAEKLPPSAWRTHTIYPRQLLEQGRAMPAKGMPASHWHKTKVTVILYIDANGNINQEIRHEPVKVGNPYA